MERSVMGGGKTRCHQCGARADGARFVCPSCREPLHELRLAYEDGLESSARSDALIAEMGMRFGQLWDFVVAHRAVLQHTTDATREFLRVSGEIERWEREAEGAEPRGMGSCLLGFLWLFLGPFLLWGTFPFLPDGWFSTGGRFVLVVLGAFVAYVSVGIFLARGVLAGGEDGEAKAKRIRETEIPPLEEEKESLTRTIQQRYDRVSSERDALTAAVDRVRQHFVFEHARDAGLFDSDDVETALSWYVAVCDLMCRAEVGEGWDAEWVAAAQRFFDAASRLPAVFRVSELRRVPSSYSYSRGGWEPIECAVSRACWSVVSGLAADPTLVEQVGSVSGGDCDAVLLACLLRCRFRRVLASVPVGPTVQTWLQNMTRRLIESGEEIGCTDLPYRMQGACPNCGGIQTLDGFSRCECGGMSCRDCRPHGAEASPSGEPRPWYGCPHCAKREFVTGEIPVSSDLVLPEPEPDGLATRPPRSGVGPSRLAQAFEKASRGESVVIYAPGQPDDRMRLG